MQEQLGERLLLIAEHEAVEHAADLGMIQRGIADEILKDQAERIRQLKKDDISSSLEIEVTELVRKVPLFQGMDESEFEDIGGYLRAKTIPRGTPIVRQG
ncbi:MAG: hypothetical protein HUJ31_18525 [Pseudomonadales bacterium]|nr:hypothetical protein [Pseudomonadales bacterium]